MSLYNRLWRDRGEYRYSSHISSTSALDKGRLSTLRPGSFTLNCVDSDNMDMMI